MKLTAALVLTLSISAIYTPCHAMRCDCEDWAQRGGYCVNYIQDRIPGFPIPTKEEMPEIKNTDVSNVTEGDVAVFRFKNFWHVAYVEKVHRDRLEQPTAIDVSEMNFGDELSFAEFKAKWKSDSPDEWNRASCCGITDNYGEVTLRKDIDVDTVTQIWSPDDVGLGERFKVRGAALVDKVRKAFDRMVDFTKTEL